MILGASILQFPTILKAKEMGLLPVVVDMNPKAVGFSEDGIIKEVISTIDKEGILEAAKRNKIDGIMTLASDMPMQSVAYVSSALGLVGVSEQTALNCTNKAFMRDCLKEHGVPIPEYFRVKDRDQYDKAIAHFHDLGIPCIVKPADNSGSRGVDKLEEYEQDAVNKAYVYSKANSRFGEIVVEEFMDGSEVSVETLSVNGTCHVIQITDKLTTGAPYFVEMGHNEPSMLSENVQKRIREVAIAANHAVGIQIGPSHTEIKVTSKYGPKIVELGARLGGDCITTHLVPLSTGVDMVGSTIRIALGEKPDIEPKWERGSAIRYLKTDVGHITSIAGIEEAKHMSGVRQVSIVHDVGEEAKEIKSSADRIGFIICQDDSPEKAIIDCERGLMAIKVKVN